jgi:hypothetical protein
MKHPGISLGSDASLNQHRRQQPVTTDQKKEIEDEHQQHHSHFAPPVADAARACRRCGLYRSSHGGHARRTGKHGERTVAPFRTVAPVGPDASFCPYPPVCTLASVGPLAAVIAHAAVDPFAGAAGHPVRTVEHPSDAA